MWIRQLPFLSLFMKSCCLIMPTQNSISNQDWGLCVKLEFYHERISVPNFHFFLSFLFFLFFHFFRTAFCSLLSPQDTCVNKIFCAAEGWYLFQSWRVLCSKPLHLITCVLDKGRLTYNGLWDPTSAFEGPMTTVAI